MATFKPDDPATVLPQDPLVDRLRPDPSSGPLAAFILHGLAGRSTRDGFVRLYFDAALNYYAEFAAADIIFSEAIPPDQPPFLGHKATRVGIRPDAVINYTRTAQAKKTDPYAVDIRRSPQVRRTTNLLPPFPPTMMAECPGETFFGCGGETLGCGTQRTNCFCPTDYCPEPTESATCNEGATCFGTCNQFTCQTCNQATCQTCNQATCQTCNQATCQTCNGATCVTCNQATCVTCNNCPAPTDGVGQTCATCGTCNPHVFTCGNQRGCL